ncbi:unnamed protein product [Lota lota]
MSLPATVLKDGQATQKKGKAWGERPKQRAASNGGGGGKEGVTAAGGAKKNGVAARAPARLGEASQRGTPDGGERGPKGERHGSLNARPDRIAACQMRIRHPAPNPLFLGPRRSTPKRS